MSKAGQSESPTIIHVTHEATEHVGGIGTVLAGLLTAPSYRAAVQRSILVAPLFHADRDVRDPRERLGEDATECLYSGRDHYDPYHFGAIFQPVEWSLGTRIVYGKRRLHSPGHEDATAEVLLCDVSNPHGERMGALKWMLFEKFGIDSRRYEHSWDYEEYCRLALMAYHALSVLLPANGTPAVVVAHEYMGMCTALRCAMDRTRFRAVFHAHECSSGRRLVEGLPGCDTAFYPALDAALKSGRDMPSVFGDQTAHARHALVGAAHRLDGIMAVGPQTADELRFMSKDMRAANVRIAYNGLPAPRATLALKRQARAKIDAFLTRTIGFAPDVLLTHVTRPVMSKGLWRDVEVMKRLCGAIRNAGKSAAYLLLTCGAPVRTPAEAEAMSREYGWPGTHREGPPDLQGPEVELHRGIKVIDAAAEQAGAKVRGVLINQFGFSRQRVGPSVDEGVTTSDLRLAADVELGMSVYEPFGIAQLEPLYGGAICVPSSACGCLGLVKRAMDEIGMKSCPLVLEADFAAITDLPAHIRQSLDAARVSGDVTLDPAVRLTRDERHAIEAKVCERVAAEIMRRLPANEAQREEHIALGQKLAERMNWNRVATTDFLPVIRDAIAKP